MGHVYPDQSYHNFLKSTKYVALTLEMAVVSLNLTCDMDTIEVPEVCALAIGRMPIVGRPIWRLTEGKHTVKLEITWQLPRITPKRKTTNKKRSAIKDDDNLVKMAESKMARLAASFNDAVCLTPSPTTEDRRAPPIVRPSTPTTTTDLETTTDHSPPGEWKEVVSKKKKILKASTRKEEPTAPRRRTPPIEQPRKIQRTHMLRTSPPAALPAPAPVPASTPLSTQRQEDAKCFLSGCGKSYPIHEKYDLDEVRTLHMNNGRQGIIVKAYRLPDEDGKTTEEAPVYFTYIEEQPYWYFLKGYSSKYYSKRFFDDIQEKFAGATPVDNNMLWYDDRERCCAGTDHPKRLARLGP